MERFGYVCSRLCCFFFFLQLSGDFVFCFQRWQRDYLKYVCDFEEWAHTTQACCQVWTGRHCEAVQLQPSCVPKHGLAVISPLLLNLGILRRSVNSLGCDCLRNTSTVLPSNIRKVCWGGPGPTCNFDLIVGHKGWLDTVFYGLLL